MPPKGKQPATTKVDVKPKPAPTTSTTVTEASETPKAPAQKPDQATHHAEQDALKKEIEENQVKLNAVKERINLSKGSGANEKRDALRAELDAIRGQQGSNKASRTKVIEQVQTLNTNIANKVKALQAAKAKLPFKNVDDVNAQIARLDALVNSGTMKLVDERKTLQEISNLKRHRKTVEAFQGEQDSIDKDRSEVEELKKMLDDPEMKAFSEKYDKIKSELDALKEESDSAYKDRSKLFDERTALQEKLDELFKRKREGQLAYKSANDAYWKKVNDDRARKAERFAAERKAHAESKKREIAEELLEQAKEPAFAAEIQDCQTLIDYFSRTSGVSSSFAEEELQEKEAAGVPKLELRKVENQMEGMTALKKKGEEENNYFVAKKSKKPIPSGKGKASAATAPTIASSSEASAPSDKLNIPFGTLSGLMALSIPPPANGSEVSRVIEDLKVKKAWYQANQARVTKENVAKAEAQIEKLNKADTHPEQATAVEQEAPVVEASA